MAKRIIPVGRLRVARRVVWEAHRVTLLMHISGGEYGWICVGDIVCVSGGFPKAFAAMNFPGFPEFDAYSPDIERELVYQGLNVPSEFEIRRYIQRKMETAMAALRTLTTKD